MVFIENKSILNILNLNQTQHAGKENEELGKEWGNETEANTFPIHQVEQAKDLGSGGVSLMTSVPHI